MVWVLRRTSVGDYLRSFRPGKVITTGWAKLAMVFGSMGAADRFRKKYHLTGYYCSELPHSEPTTKKEEPMKTKPTCYMCDKKPKPMTARMGEVVLSTHRTW
jgi:hypothetical protein